MNYFDYPLDTKMLLRKKRTIRRKLLCNGSGWIEKKVAVLGGSTTDEVVDQLELFLLYYGIRAEFYQSEYGRYWEDAIFGNPKLDNFKPDIVYIHVNWRNITEFPSMESSAADVEAMLLQEYERFSSMWVSVKQKYNCLIIQNNFERPDYRLLGNRDVWDFRGRSNYISRLNQKFYEYAQNHSGFYINDIDYLAQDFGLSEWGNPFYWNMYKYACALNAVPYLAASVANIIKSIYGKNKKLLALDLDNTLWGGVIGDDGVEGILLGKELPRGQVYYDFQKYCKNLQQIGVVLSVNSKNDLENALAGLSHPDSVLGKDDFVAVKANWNPKDQNLKEIADELSLGLESFVFVDDNPAEREIVKAQIPCVAVPDMNRAENYIRVLDHSGYFEATELSLEDGNKTRQYQARAKAISAQAAFTDYDEYLSSLQMKATISGFEPIYIQRIAQLTNKSNQFNLTTLRCNEEEIRAMQNDNTNICLCGRLIDKFEDNGIVTVAVGKIQQDELYIKLWLMSCRVLKRGLEDAMMNTLISTARDRNIKRIVGFYFPTSKNQMVKDFYRDMGFQLVSEDKGGNTSWSLETDSYQFRNTQIEITENKTYILESEEGK